MDFGKIDIGLGGGADRYKDNTARLESDIFRLVLLLGMLFAAIIGGICNSRMNQPTAVISTAVKKTLDRPFQTSIEGNISMYNRTLEMYRLHHRYSPSSGLSILSSTGSSDEVPFDPVDALNLILKSGNPIEYSPEDMYARPTLHFSGSFRESPGDSLRVYVFNCWIDMKTRVMVRLELSGVQRNAGVDEAGEPVSRETYLNIRYYGYEE